MIYKVLEEIFSTVRELLSKEEAWLILALIGVGSVTIFVVPDIDPMLILITILNFFKYTWWLWVFLILFPIFKDSWVHWRQEIFKSSLKFILLEIRIPREIEKSPQAMEQVLAALHSLRNAPGDIREKYAEGEVTVWFSLELVSFSGEIHFYIRCQKKQRNLVEAAFFSYYPDVEMVEVPDYADTFPKNIEELYMSGKDMWGTEMVLSRDELYPIKTYPFFEHEADEKKFDPISTFLEVLGKLKPGEVVAMQFLIAPSANDWAKKWEASLEKLQEPTTAEIETDEGGTRNVPISRTPGQYDVLEAVERNLSKPAFDTLIRFMYLSPKDIYYDSFARRGLVGAFNQYGALNLNSLIQNYPVSTRTMIWYWPHVFPKVRNEFKKQRLLYNYIRREVPPEKWIGRVITSKFFNWNFLSRKFTMNIEGIATIFHLPTSIVLTAPHIKRNESKKGGAPAGLAIYGEEEEIQKFFE